MSPTPKFSCILAGAESLLIQCGELILEQGHEIRGIVSRSAQISEWARSQGLPIIAPGKELARSLESLEFDYLFSITNLAMLPEEVLSQARKASINFHDGPLPRYAGMYAPAWAIINGETEYGISFHEMLVGADEGAIQAKRHFPIAPDDTSLTLNTRCYEAAIDAFAELIEGLAAGTVRPEAQDMAQRSYFGRQERPDNACALDWRQPAETIARLVRATQFGRYENAFASAKIVHRDRVCLVGSADAGTGNGDPGTLVEITEDSLVVASEDATIALGQLSCPRGLPLTGAEAAERLGIRQGERFEAPPAERMERLSELAAEATRHEAYWVRRLSRLDPVEIPYLSREHGSDTAPDFCMLEIEVPTSFRGRFGDAGGQGVVSAFAAYLSRVTGRANVELAYSDPALQSRIAGLEAFFSNALPLQIDFAADTTSSQAVGAVAAATEKDRATFHTDVVARYPQLSATPVLALGGLTAVATTVSDDFEAFVPNPGTDFALLVSPAGDRARFVHDALAQTPESARAIQTQFTGFMARLAEGEADEKLARVSLLDEETHRRMLFDWNDTTTAVPEAHCIHTLFEEQVDRTPDAVAVVFEGESLSYAQLDARANQLANHLRGLDIGPDQLVGIYLERSLEMMVGILGVLKAGGAYVPLDPTYPADRIEHMIRDSQAPVLLAQERLLESLPDTSASVVVVDRDRGEIEQSDARAPQTDVEPENLAYVIYTSGSTGKPKGVMVEHRNAVNFFVGMDDRVAHESPGCWLAVTTLSFDISVLELLWTLTRGFKVVVHADRERSGGDESNRRRPWRPMDFGLAMWGSDAGPGPAKYELMLESAKFGDRHDFTSFHTPERHFGAFGGPFPNPAVTSAAIAAVTQNIKIRASSCVLPLHHPVRVAEEWAVVDNLSDGRVEISFATGWQPNDFVIRPSGHGQSSDQRFEDIDKVERLWRGDAVEFENPMGAMVPTSTLPRPVQQDLPVWITSASNVQTFEEAGARGYNLLTHLLGQNLEEVSQKIAAYRRARKAAGLDPAAGIVTLMLHTFVGTDNDHVRELVRAPMKDYLASAMKLVMGFAWSFPAFKRPGGPDAKLEDVDLASLTEEERDTILEFAFERYYETSGLFGTPDMCASMVESVKDAGVDEICCLIDFGLPKDTVLEGLDLLNLVRKRSNEKPIEAVSDEVPPADYSLVAQIEGHAVTHLQCTPSMAEMLITNAETRDAVGSVDHLMIGGEAFPVALATELDRVASGTITNMYGPTETTIWSSTESVVGAPSSISIGRPIANTQFYILDTAQQPVPVGIPGELLIGGDGVVRGYHNRSELTGERFIPDPFSDRPGARLYRTGDLARWREDGTIDFLGRLDHQVKIRGYRIELGEIEARLGQVPDVQSCVVVAREDNPGDHRLVAYLTSNGAAIPHDALRDALRTNLPEFMIPSAFVELERFPQTPNGKIDRKALPAPDQVGTGVQVEYVAPENELERMLAEVWTQVLQMDSFGVDDNFFDLGGHSLLVVQAHRKLREVCPVPVSLTDLYRFPTIRGLATFLGSDASPGEAVRDSQARGEKRRQAAAGRRRRRGTRG